MSIPINLSFYTYYVLKNDIEVVDLNGTRKSINKGDPINIYRSNFHGMYSDEYKVFVKKPSETSLSGRQSVYMGIFDDDNVHKIIDSSKTISPF